MAVEAILQSHLQWFARDREFLGAKNLCRNCETAGYADYVKFVGFQLWQTLSNALEVKLQRTTFNSEAINETRKTGIQPKTYRNIYDHPTPYTPSSQDWGEAMDVSVFMDALRIDNIGSMDYSRAVPFSCNFRDRRYWQNYHRSAEQIQAQFEGDLEIAQRPSLDFCSIVWLMFLQAIRN